MHCGGCVGTVEQALRQCPAVATASVNLTTELARVELCSDPRATVGEHEAEAIERIAAAVRDAGFEALPVGGRRDSGNDRRAERQATLTRERRKLQIAAIVGLPLALAHLLPHEWLMVAGWHTLGGWLVQAALAALVVALAGATMLQRGLQSAVRLHGNMDALVALAVTASLATGLAGIALRQNGLLMFDAAALIVLFVGLGRVLEAGAQRAALSAFESLADRIPRRAVRVRDGESAEIDVDHVLPGDELLVAAPATVPVDADIVRGKLTLDESLLTGESLPVSRGVGEPLPGGALAVEGTAVVRATARGEQSAAARIAAMVESAQAGKTPWQRLADRVAGVFVPAVVALSLATFLGWWLVAGATAVEALTRAIAVLVVACPCAMGLAIPTAVVVASAAAAQRGILVRDGATFEAAASVDTVIFDKTGTLTRGVPAVTDIVAIGVATEAEVLRLAASAEQGSQHPLGRAIVAAARSRGPSSGETVRVENRAGDGVVADVRIDGVQRTVVVGRREFVESSAKCSFARGGAEADADGAQQRLGEVWVAVDRVALGCIRLADELHSDARAAIDDLRALGVSAQLLSGDRRAVAERVAREIGIDDVRAEMSPAEKLAAIEASLRGGSRVAMVGDGINDGPALAAATVGIAIGTGAQLAVESAGVCLVAHNPRLVAVAIRVSRATVSVMRQNLAWAFGYNAALLPVAALTHLPPAWAAAAMMLSSFSVVANSLRLRGLRM